MNTAEIDINVFKSYSTGSASTSGAKSVNVPIDTILKSAGWSQTGTFLNFTINQFIMIAYIRGLWACYIRLS